MKTVMIAPLGGDAGTIFVGLREFPTEKVILIPNEGELGEARNTQKELEKFRVPVEIEELNSSDLEGMFEAVSYIREKEKGKELTMNLGAASKMMSCAATAAAFVNGIKAYDVNGNEVVFLPVLKFSYYDMLSDKKMRILKLLKQKENIDSLETVSREIGLGPSLINYHVYGNEKNQGLKELGLVEVKRENGKVKIGLSTMGKLLLKEKK